jgi:hypothetical protein
MDREKKVSDIHVQELRDMVEKLNDQVCKIKNDYYSRFGLIISVTIDFPSAIL